MSEEIAVQGSRVITVNLPQKTQLDAQAQAAMATVESIDIDSQSMMEIAAEELLSIKSQGKKLEEARKFHVGPLNSEVKYINDWFREAIDTLEQAESTLKRKMIAFQTEQEKQLREKQAKIEAEQRKERARIAAENEQRELAARALAATQPEEEAKTTLAAAAEQNAASETVALVMTPPAINLPPKIAGISTKGTYKGRVIDKLALIRFIANNPQYENLVISNDPAINQIAKAQRGACQIDGIEVYEDKVLAARRK